MAQVEALPVYGNSDPATYLSIDWSDVDVVVFNRWLNKLQYNVFEEIKKHNVKIILDLDDYWNIPKGNQAYELYKWHIKDATKNSMLVADMVWTTTPILAEKIKEFNTNVHVIPNALNLAEKQWNGKRPKDAELTVGWIGGNSHLEDIKFIQEIMPKIHERTGATFLMGGHHEKQPFWQYMEQIIYGKQKRPNWFKPREGTTALRYGLYYAECDIMLAPLSGYQHFNRYKSELKIIEAAAYNLPIVCSNVEPYTLHKDNKGCMLVDNSDKAWSEAIEHLCKLPELREHMGADNWHYCKEHHDLDTINKKRLYLIKELL